MPCVTPLATGRELEFGWVSEHLKEVSGQTPHYNQVNYDYWSVDTTKLDELTDQLCKKCHLLGEHKIATMSIYLQYWWKRHKMHDDLQEFRSQLGLNNVSLPGD